jgi:hypothetical protein
MVRPYQRSRICSHWLHGYPAYVQAFAVKEKVSAVMSVSKATIPRSFFMAALLFFERARIWRMGTALRHGGMCRDHIAENPDGQVSGLLQRRINALDSLLRSPLGIPIHSGRDVLVA